MMTLFKVSSSLPALESLLSLTLSDLLFSVTMVANSSSAGATLCLYRFRYLFSGVSEIASVSEVVVST
jgi:hypothetical protein